MMRVWDIRSTRVIVLRGVAQVGHHSLVVRRAAFVWLP
jgi:hypothetical protein